MRLVVLGPPGAGKGTQAVRIADHYGCSDVATGDIFRANVAEGTELGRVAQAYMDRGDLVPDEVVIAMVMERLAERDCASGFVLDGFPRTVNQAEALDRRLGELGTPLQAALSFEITEDTIMADPVRGMDVLRDLGDLGVGMALDDFGTGWSSLAHLRRMPVEELKIDRSFVSRMTENHDDAVIVRSTVELARNLRLGVVAEGVEDLATWAYLSEIGCDVIQGFGVSPPLPAAQATVWLAARAQAMQPST